MGRRVMLVVAVGLAAGAAFAQSGSIVVDGKERDFVVHAPSGLPEHPPLVLALHPLSGSGPTFQSMSGWDEIADREKFVVVYPTGITQISMGGRNMPGWDITGDSDVKFILALIDTMAARHATDRQRVYATGFSMGGMLSYVLACRESESIAAIGPDGGYPVGQSAGNCKASAPVPVCHVHGADDDFVTYGGASAWIERFAEINGCGETPATSTPSSKAKKEDWAPCKDGNDVIFYTVIGMDHDYATSSRYEFSATDTFWAFFKTHSRGGSTAVRKTPSGESVRPSFSATRSGGAIRFSAGRGITAVGIFDIRGRTVYRSKHQSRHTGEQALQEGRRSPGGVYIIKTTGSGGSAIGRILVP